MQGTSTSRRTSVYLRPVQALTALYCLLNHKMLLGHELDRDRDLSRSAKSWERIRAAAIAGRTDDIPIAGETLNAWGFTEARGDEVLGGCGEYLPDAVRAVEVVWDESQHEGVHPEALRTAFGVAAARRESLLADYRPPAPGVRSPWHEVHQGCARPDALSRVRVLHLVDRALSRSTDRWVLACVDLDHATRYDAEGKYQTAREALDAAVRESWPLKSIGRREPAPVALAEHLWRCGEALRANQLLSQLRGKAARELSLRFEEKAPQREALAGAERVRRERNGVGAWSSLALAHLSAGHEIVAERMARELCTEHPDDARSWETKARVLHANSRHLSAIDAAEKWTDLAPDSAAARSLLARALARMGHLGREPAASIAAAAIEFCNAGQVLPVDELEALAEICYRAEFVDWARRADDLTWAHRAEREPGSEWLVAAVARRCHGPWADDAPEWLARLATRGAHALQRWGVERVDSLQHWCDLVDRQMRAPAPWRRLETVLTPGARAIAREANDRTMHSRAHDAVLRAACGLGYSEETIVRTLEAPGPEPEATALPETASDSSPQWNRHRAAIESAFGPRLVIALRASEAAQQAWTAILDDRPNGASLIIREIFHHEKLAWARWAQDQPVGDRLYGAIRCSP